MRRVSAWRWRRARTCTGWPATTTTRQRARCAVDGVRGEHAVAIGAGIVAVAAAAAAAVAVVGVQGG